MKKNTTKYGVIIIPKGTVLCTMEKGGDKDGKARYRFSDSGKRTASRLVALVSDETIMNDLYDAPWAHTDKGWVKAEDKITWYNSYKEASDALASLTNRKRKIILWILIAVLFAALGYLIYKHYQGKTEIQTVVPDIEPAAEPIVEPETIIPDEIQVD